MMSHTSEQPPYISFLNEPHYPVKLLACQKAQAGL